MKTLLSLLIFSWLFTLPVFAGEWKAGAAGIAITPEHSMWMAGYGGRKEPSSGTETDLFAKALVLSDGENPSGLVVTLDLVGIDRDFSEDLCDRIKKEHGFERSQIALCTSHTHSGPVVGTNLGPLHYWSLDEDQQSLIEEYAETLKKKILTVVGEAEKAMQPVRVQSGSGKSTFAVNRRNNKPYDEVPDRRAHGVLAGPVDHDVPVLTFRDSEGALVAIIFGYACHATTLGLNQWNGDYPGYAQAALEKKYPGSVALFWAGCGGDQNPLPRKELALAVHYGEELARAVSDVIAAPMPELEPKLQTHFSLVPAPLAKIPTKEELLAAGSSTDRFEVARSRYLLDRIEKKGGLKDSYPYPIGQWQLGNRIDWVFLGGEVVVDYALRIKQERKGTDTWVAAYSNDVMAYIPSLRVLKEGGYEGGGSNKYYGLPSLWGDSIEETIVHSVPTP